MIAQPLCRIATTVIPSGQKLLKQLNKFTLRQLNRRGMTESFEYLGDTK
jgi:hypothetical protein